jgi:amino acid adenylation domain-containing protein
MLFNLLQYFENIVSINPDKIAVKEESDSINFKNLQFRSKVLASLIKKTTSGKINSPIAVFLPKSINCIISDIACTYSGNPYMNLDVKAPSTRINNILKQINPIVIITTDKFESLLPEMSPSVVIINLDSVDYENSYVDNDILTYLLDNIIDTDPYCIINTSGSTGTPKGVVLNYKSFIDFTEWSIEKFNFKQNEIIGSLSPQVFDIYSYELCLLMSKGSTIILIPERLAAFPIKIIEIIQYEKVTFLFWVPTIMVNISNMNLLEDVKLQDLRLVWFAGEVFPTKQFNYWRKQLPEVLFVNLYGPIEITLDCTYFIVNREIPDDEPLPIGIPCRNTSVLILNEKNELVKKGEEGELCIRGTSLAMGYYNNEEKTSSAFVQNPLNSAYPEIIYRTGDIVCYNERSEIIFKGRKDSLIKHLGYRIELGEIEHVIVNILQIVKNCCVVYNIYKKEITTIYEANEDINDSDFRKKLLDHFPKYMLPSKFIRMNELPRNTNGKIDRLALKDLVNESK